MKVRFIVNPRSGRHRRTAAIFGALRDLLSSRRLDAEAVATEGPGHATAIAKEAVAEGCARVIAVGGDGTVNEVANGLLAAESNSRLGVLPIASGGDFARALRLTGLRHAIRTLAAGHWRPLDAVRARFHGPDGPAVRHFVNMASAGLGGLVAADVQQKWRFLPGRVRYLAATIPRLAAGCAYPIRLSLDDVHTGAFDATIVSLANGRYQGGGILIAPEAAWDDGLIGITLVEEVSLAEVLKRIRLLYNGNVYIHPKVHHWQARRVRVDGDAPLELDGEPLGRLPLEAEILPQALPVICPALPR